MSATDLQSIPLELGGGLDQSTGDKRLRLPSMAVVDNVRVDRQGVYRKRDGNESLNAAGNTGSGTASTLVENRGQLGLIGADGLYAHTDGDGVDRWVRRNTSSIYPVSVDVQKLVATGGLATDPDVAFLSSGLGCVVWQESTTNVTYALWINDDGSIVSGPERVGTNVNYDPRIIVVDGRFVVVAYDTDPTVGIATPYIARYNGFFGFNTPVSTGLSIQQFDIYGEENESVFYWVSPNLIRSYDSSGTLVNNQTLSNSANGYIYHDTGAQRVIVAYQDTSGTNDWNVQFRSEDLATTHSTTTLIASGSLPSWHDYGRGFVRALPSGYVAAVSDGYTPGITWAEFDSSGALTESRELRGLQLASRGALDDEAGFVFCVHNAGLVLGASGGGYSAGRSTHQRYPGLWLVRVADNQGGETTIQYLARLSDSPSLDNGFDSDDHMTSFLSLGDGRVVGVATRVQRNTTVFDQVTGGVDIDTDAVARLDLYVADLRATALRSSPAQESTLVSGGYVGAFDRGWAVENSIHAAPDLVGGAVDVSSGTLTSQGEGGSYAAAQVLLDLSVVARWVDSTGKIHRSPASVPVSIKLGARIDDKYYSTADIDLLVKAPPSGINGDNLTDLHYELYAWSYNDLEGGSLVTTNSRLAQGSTRYLVHVFREPTVWATDTNYLELKTNGYINLAQANIVSGVAEYVQNGELSSDPTEAALDVATSSTRAFYLTRSYVAYSKPFTDLYAPEFNDAQRLRIPDGAGVAVEVMDDTLVVFTDNGVYTTSVAGGPDANGAGQTFGDLRRVPSDGGCTERRGVVLTPRGVVFPARNGLYLVDRSQNVSFVGAPVQVETASGVVASALLPQQSEAWWLLSGGTAVCWDYDADLWTRRTGLPTVDMQTSDGKLHMLASDFAVYRQTPDTYTDAFSSNTYVLTSTETPWIPMAGPMGYQIVDSFWILGQHFGGDLRVRLYYDYSSTPDEVFTFDEDTMVRENGQIRIKPSRITCAAIKIELDEEERGGESAGTTNLGGFWLEEIQVDVRGLTGGYGRDTTTART